jgi:hypothetical protein
MIEPHSRYNERKIRVPNNEVTIKGDDLKDLSIRHENWSTLIFNDNESKDIIVGL